MEKILISACLAGDPVRYDGKQTTMSDPLLHQWESNGQLIKACPEVLGEMTIPRPPAQIVDGDGRDVLRGKARVMDENGRDVTRFFIQGAECTLSLVKTHHIQIAVLKEKSPSCGVRFIYDGTFTSTLIPGYGVTTALLKENRVRVFSENELEQVIAVLKTCH